MRAAIARRRVGDMMPSLRRWWASEHRALFLDAVLAVSLGIVSIFVASRVAELDGGSVQAGAVALLVVQSVALIFRRRWPMVVYSIVGFSTVAYAWLGYPESVGGFGVLIAIYTVAAHLPVGEAVVAAAIYVVGMALSLVGFARDSGLALDILFADFLVNLLALVLAWTVGVTIRTRRAYVAALEARAELLEREREDNARLAVALERGRIAREMHDVVAHSVSVVVVQAAAAERLVESDPERARQAMRDVATTGRQALTEMRRLLGVLRDGDASDDLGPQPGVAELRALAGTVEDAGMQVELSVQGEERPLPASAALSVYRIVQEALTNSLRHAGPARARVILRYLPDALEVQVSDNGSGGMPTAEHGGHGLIGMRERVALFGGELTAGPRPEGGYAVVARIPTSGTGT